MIMPDDEIITSYRQAKYQQDQIKILADLNQCGTQDIINILSSRGIDAGQFNKRKYTRISPEAIKAVKALYEQGKIAEDISEATGESKATVNYLMHRFRCGIEYKRRKDGYTKEENKLFEYYITHKIQPGDYEKLAKITGRSICALKGKIYKTRYDHKKKENGT